MRPVAIYVKKGMINEDAGWQQGKWGELEGRWKKT